MNRALSWGSTGWNMGSMPTSNSEYGRALMAQRSGDPNNNATSVYVAGSPVFTPGHSHSPGCVHYGAGGGQTTGSYAQTGRGGVYGTGGNSSTDFQVLTGDAAAAVLDQSNYQHGQNFYNYAIQAPGAAGEAGNEASAPSAETGAGEGSGSPAVASINGRQIQGTNMSAGDYAAATNAGQQQQTTAASDGMVPATGLRMAKPKPPRYMTANPTMPHVYSSVRAAKKGSDPAPNFVLCGKCIKCKKLQDPGALIPANTNFKNQGLTPSGSTRFAMPKATASTPDLKKVRPPSAFSASGKTLKKDSRQVIHPANQTGSLTKM